MPRVPVMMLEIKDTINEKEEEKVRRRWETIEL